MNTKALGLAVLLVVGCGGNANSSLFDEPGDSGAIDDGAIADTTEPAKDGTPPKDTGRPDTAPVDTFNPEADDDGDGYKAKVDCDDKNPLVNPGAFDVPGNGKDDDCNGKIDDVVDCDLPSLKLDTNDAEDFAKALGICKKSSGEGDWGLVSAKLTKADGSGGVKPIQHGIHPSFGKNVVPREGKNLVVLSTGTARLPSQAGWMTPFSPSFKDDSSSVTPPLGWPKTTPGCKEPTSKNANDSVALQLELRVPTNAKGLRFALDFYTTEYLNFVCSSYNDHFVALLESKAPLDAKHSLNVSFDAKGEPITSNSSLIDVCTPGTKDGKTYACTRGTKELEGTGFLDDKNPNQGGATGWLETHAAVMPGETIKLRFVIWDVSDHILDSTVLLDALRWDTTGPATPVTERAK